MSEVYSKQVMDQYLQAIFQIQTHTLRLVMEDRIANGRISRDETADYAREMSAACANPAVKAFYDALAGAVAEQTDPSQTSKAALSVIEGGRVD